MDWIEIQFWKLAKRIIIKGYGRDCRGMEEPECAGCQAEATILWIEKHIELLEYFK